MSPDTKVPPPSSYCYAIRLSNRRTKDAAINKCPIALDRQKEPNSALHPRDTSGDHPEQDGLAQWVEERDEHLEKQRDTLSEQASTIAVKHKDASDKLDGRARTAHESTACALRAGLGSLHIIRKEGGTNSQRTQLTQSHASGPNQLTGILEGSHATRIRLAQKSLSITLPLS